MKKQYLFILLLFLGNMIIYAQCSVNAGGSTTICGTSYTMQGSSSGSTGGVPVWSLVSKPSGAPDPVISNVNSLTPNVTGMTFPGNYVFQVTQNCSPSGSATSQVTIMAPGDVSTFTAGPDIDNISAVAGTATLNATIPAGYTASWTYYNLNSFERNGSVVTTNATMSGATTATPTLTLTKKADHDIDPVYRAVLRITSTINPSCWYEDNVIVRFIPNPNVSYPNSTNFCSSQSTVAKDRYWYSPNGSSPLFSDDTTNASANSSFGTSITMNVISQPAGGNISYGRISNGRLHFASSFNQTPGAYVFTLTISNANGSYTTQNLTFNYNGSQPENLSFLDAAYPEQMELYSSGNSGGAVYCNRAGTTNPITFYFKIDPLDSPALTSTVYATGIIPAGGAPSTIVVNGEGTRNRSVTLTAPVGGWRVGTYKFSVSVSNGTCSRARFFYLHISDGNRPDVEVDNMTVCYPGSGVVSATIPLPAVYQGVVAPSYYQDFSGRYELTTISRPAGSAVPVFESVEFREITDASTIISNLNMQGEYRFSIRAVPPPGGASGFLTKEYACSGTSLEDEFSIFVLTQVGANAGSAQTLVGTSQTTFNGNNPGVATGSWSLISKPAGATDPIIATPSAYNTNVTGLISAGTYIFRWTVTTGTCVNTSDLTVNVIAAVAGGVTGADFWIKSDDAGTIATAWKDHSANANNIPNVGGMTLSPADRKHNFHPYTTGYTTSKFFYNNSSVMNPTNGELPNINTSIFSAVRPTTVNGTGRITGIDDDVNYASEPGFSIASGKPRQYEYWNTTTSSDFSTTFDIGQSNIFSAIANNTIANGGTSAISGGEKRLGLNGVYESFSGFAAANKFQIYGRNLRVGHAGWDAPGAFPGDIMEVIWYKRPLTANEQSRVNSYLAVKNGVTLNENYLSTTSSVVWDRTNNASYNNNIFGIARDNVTALHQKQAGSVNSGQQLVISTIGFADSNAANSTGLVNDLQFLMTGDNGLKQSLAIPLAYTAGSNGTTNYRFESIWKVQNTGSIETVTVAWPKGVKNLYLVQSSNEVFDGTDTFTPMVTEVTINGVVYNTANVTLANGQFFTFAGYAKAPAGVVDGIARWYRSDRGVGLTSGTVSSLVDQVSTTEVITQATAARRPAYNSASNFINFNPNMMFSQNPHTALNSLTAGFAPGTTGLTTFSVAIPATSTLAQRKYIFGMTNVSASGNTAAENSKRISVGNALCGNSTTPNIGKFRDCTVYANTGSWVPGIPSILKAGSLPAPNNISFFISQNGNTNATGNGVVAMDYSETGFGLASGGDNDNNTGVYGWNGQISEVILYGGELSETNQRRVDSYLAIKHGLTLERVATNHYLGSTASASSIVWNGASNTVYNNNIFGIARADIGDFEQKVSKSINTGTILTVAKNNDFTSGNLAGSRTGLPNDESYLILGDNNNVTTTTAPTPSVGLCGEDLGNGDEFRTIPRKWMVQRTNDLETAYLQVNMASYSAGINANVMMLVADDEAFTQNVVAVPGTQNGNLWTFAHDFDNDNAVRYITFGGTYVVAPCEQCKGGTYTLRTGNQWNQGSPTNQINNSKLNILLGNDAEGNPLYASMFADYSANPAIEYIPNRYPRQYGGRWTMARRYDNTNAQVKHRIELTKAMKASFQISNINTYRNNKNNFIVVGYCNGVAVMPKITYAYNTSYHTFDITGNQAIGTLSWRGYVPNVSTANVRFDRPVDRIEIIDSVDRVNTAKTLRSILYSDITLECAAVVEPLPDNVYVSHSFTQDTVATCGGETTMRIKVTNNNVCDSKTIDLHQLLPSGLSYVTGSFNGNDLPAGAMTSATLSYTGGNFELSGLTLPRGEHYMYVDIANPGVAGTYPTQFTYEVTNGINPAATYSSPTVNLNYYQSLDPAPAAPTLTLSIKNNVICGTNNLTMTYRMKIVNPNVTPITGAEILHMFDHDQLIQNVVYVAGEDEDGVITGNYPVDGNNVTIDPINSAMFNLVDASIPVGISYIDITVNTGNSYNDPVVQASGISSTFIVGFGSGECAESAESLSNEVVLPMCTSCYKPGITTGTASDTKVGITSLNRAGADQADNWPMARKGGWIALESKTKAFVPNRVAFSGGNPVGIAPANFVEGMMVYDDTNKCMKIYTLKEGDPSMAWHCMTTQTCPE